MMFKANNCWEFRQIVQELTGQATEKKSTNNTGYMNEPPQATTMINVMDRKVNEDLLRPSSSIRSVYRSSSTENVYEESTAYSSSASEPWYTSSSTEHPSSPVEYVHEEKLRPSSSTQFVDDFFSVEMLEKMDEFQYPFSNL